MHTMWKGSLSFGLVNVPIRMFAATESKDLKFRYLHAECKTPIEYTRTCPQCNRQIEWSEIVRGFEYQPNQFVVLDEDELKAATQARSQTIDITDFVELEEIDPIYFDKSYYLAPEASGKKAYRLLASAMQGTNKIAIAKTVLRNHETLACVRVYGHVLMMETLFWPDEVRAVSELPNIPQTGDVIEQELSMAKTLIEQLGTTFSPDKYQDSRREALMQVIQQKIDKQEVAIGVPSGRTPENVLDLMQALQESIRRTQPGADRSAKRPS